MTLIYGSDLPQNRERMLRYMEHLRQRYAEGRAVLADLNGEHNPAKLHNLAADLSVVPVLMGAYEGLPEIIPEVIGIKRHRKNPAAAHCAIAAIAQALTIKATLGYLKKAAAAQKQGYDQDAVDFRELAQEEVFRVQPLWLLSDERGLRRRLGNGVKYMFSEVGRHVAVRAENAPGFLQPKLDALIAGLPAEPQKLFDHAKLLNAVIYKNSPAVQARRPVKTSRAVMELFGLDLAKDAIKSVLGLS